METQTCANDANLTKIQSRQLKLLELQHGYQIHKQTVRILSLTALILLALAWITTLYWRFTLPFFLLHSLGTSLMLINQMTTKPPNDSFWLNQIKDIKMWFLGLLTLITLFYLFRSIRQCPF
jgi:hypothetical protein